MIKYIGELLAKKLLDCGLVFRWKYSQLIFESEDCVVAIQIYKGKWFRSDNPEYHVQLAVGSKVIFKTYGANPRKTKSQYSFQFTPFIQHGSSDIYQESWLVPDTDEADVMAMDTARVVVQMWKEKIHPVLTDRGLCDYLERHDSSRYMDRVILHIKFNEKTQVKCLFDKMCREHDELQEASIRSIKKAMKQSPKLYLNRKISSYAESHSGEWEYQTRTIKNYLQNGQKPFDE